jgi:hypothetical protein
LLDAFWVVTKQRFYGVNAVDFFQLTHDLALGLRDPPLLGAGAAPDFGGPLRCLLGLEGLPASLAGAALPDFPDADARPPLFAFAQQRLLQFATFAHSAFLAAASLGR